MDIKKSWLFSRPIAHRGLHNAEVPENSIKAFELAIEKGFPIELDVRPIDDGTVVVFHDDRLTRLTDRDGYVCNLSRSDLDEIRLKNSDEKIPTFAEVLEFVNGRTPILIEIKNESKIGSLERNTLDLLNSYNGEFAVQAFNPYSLEFFKKNAPQIPRGQLSCFFAKEELSSWFKRHMLKRLKLNKVSAPQFLSYKGENLPNKYVTRAKLPVLAWTVRSNADLEAFRPYCDNIIFENFIPVMNDGEEEN